MLVFVGCFAVWVLNLLQEVRMFRQMAIWVWVLIGEGRGVVRLINGGKKCDESVPLIVYYLQICDDAAQIMQVFAWLPNSNFEGVKCTDSDVFFSIGYAFAMSKLVKNVTEFRDSDF